MFEKHKFHVINEKSQAICFTTENFKFDLERKKFQYIYK